MATDATLSLPRYLRREEAARYIRETWGLPCAPKWLAKLAVEGGGPAFRKAGRFPMYAPSELDKWAEGRLGASQTSTTAYSLTRESARDR
jgi:hypothetical protein